MQNISEGNTRFESTINTRKLIGKNVLSQKGKIVGKIKEIRINPNKKQLEGVVVRIPKQPLTYIDHHHIEHISNDAIILSIEPSIFNKGKKILSYNGEYLGRVKDVIRVGNKNEIDHLVIKSPLRGKFTISHTDIHSIGGESIILNEKHNAPKKSISKLFRRKHHI